MKLCILIVFFSFASCSNKYEVDADYDQNYELGRGDYGDQGGYGPESFEVSRNSAGYRNNDQGYGRNDQEYGKNSRGYSRNDGFLRDNKGYRDLQRYRDRSGLNYGDLGSSDYEYNYDKGNYDIQRDRNRQRDSRTYYTEEEKERLDRIFGYTGPTANDEPENLMRPCALEDWQCIRKYFAANSKCKPAYGPIPDPLRLDVNTVYYPVNNLTLNFANLIVRGLSNAKITDFYVNKRSGNLVLTIDVQNMNQTSPRVYVRYRRTARESIILADVGSYFFRGVTFTAVIPKVPDLRLDYADIHADIADPIPLFIFGPGTHLSPDPDVVTGFAQFPVLLPFEIREGFLFQAQLFTAIFIQKNICDFGLKFINT